MLRQRVIQKPAAVLITLLLLMGIMPKPVVHEWITGCDHHVSAQTAQAELDQAAPLLTCDCQQVVFSSPFVAAEEIPLPSPLPAYPALLSYFPEQVHDAVPDSRASRGPPALI